MEQNVAKNQGPVVRSLADRVEIFKKRICENLHKYKDVIGCDEKHFKKNQHLQ